MVARQEKRGITDVIGLHLPGVIIHYMLVHYQRI